MPADQSNLSSSKYGYDFVVATTQESINAGLREYLYKVPQEPKVLCFLADETGNPTKLIELEELKKRTDGIDPFDIKNDTDYSDSRITKLTGQRFEYGLRLKLGLPPGVKPKDLTIVDLGSSANNVRFNLYCSELTIIQNTPAGGFSKKGSWNVWSQPSGKPWYFSTTVNLVYKDLDSKLNTPYFNNHPEEKQKILAQLNNLGDAAFSLRQLLFDLDNAALESLPQVEGLEEGSNAKLALDKSFPAYLDQARECGEPVLSVHAEISNPNPSRLVLTASQTQVDLFHLTAMEREACRFVDGNGVPVEHPAPEQVKVTTLAYLCAVNNHPLPGAASFNWNWVEPSDAQAMSGVVAINRNALAAYYKRQLQELLSGKLVKLSASISGPEEFKFSWDITTGGTLEDKDCIITPDGEKILTISYSSNSDAQQTNKVTYDFEFSLHATYTCSVSFKETQITIIQQLTIWMRVVKLRAGFGPPQDMAAAAGNVVDKTITDTYTLSVDQAGNLQAPPPHSDTQDNSQQVDVSPVLEFFEHINDLIDAIKNKASSVVSTSFQSIPAATIKSFVFPSGRVFAFKDVRFSSHQDLVTEITYVTPTNKNPAFLTM
ncbi:MAG: hypothetical protein ABW047_02465 [Nitrospiraceae bacterium]|jgi:hypothetical protein